MKIGSAAGSFTLHKNPAKPAVFLTGGIGITPFLSRHPKRLDIEAALFEKKSLRRIAELFGTSAWAVRRHELHLTQQFAKDQVLKGVPAEIAPVDDLLTRVEGLMARCERIAVAAEAEKK